MNIITHNKQSQLSKKIKSVAKIWKLKIDFNTLLNLVMWTNYYISMSYPIYLLYHPCTLLYLFKIVNNISWCLDSVD